MSGGEATRLFAVVGDPVAHSLSPRMHNAAIGALGLDARYVALRTTRQAFPALVRELLESGGGCNVTTPFKDDAFALNGEHSEVARRVRAVNTIYGDAAHPRLDNTDVAGIRRALDELLDTADVHTVRLFGTGGAARAAAVAVTESYAGVMVHVVSRENAHTRDFVRWAGEAGVRCEAAPPLADADDDLYVNATPELAALPRRAEDGPHQGHLEPVPGAYLDLNYRTSGIPIVDYYREHHDVAAADGRDVLLYQGVAAFERFFGVAAPVGVMRETVEYALRRE